MDFQERSRAYYGKIFPEDKINGKTMQIDMISENSVVLDVGCANGEMGEYLFLHKNCTMFGMDYNSFSLENARKTNAYRELLQVDLNVFSIQDFPHFHQLFDYIVLGDVLEHLMDPAGVLRKLKHFLKPTGKFIISLPNLAHISIKLQLIHDEFNYTPTGLLDQTHFRFFTWKTFPKFFAALSLKIEKATGTVKGMNWEEEYQRFSELPIKMRRIFFDDIHSWVFQYVMLISQSELAEEELCVQNLKQLHFTNETLPWTIYSFHSRRHRIFYVFMPKFYQKWLRMKKG